MGKAKWHVALTLFGDVVSLSFVWVLPRAPEVLSEDRVISKQQMGQLELFSRHAANTRYHSRLLDTLWLDMPPREVVLCDFDEPLLRIFYLSATAN